MNRIKEFLNHPLVLTAQGVILIMGAGASLVYLVVLTMMASTYPALMNTFYEAHGFGPSISLTDSQVVVAVFRLFGNIGTLSILAWALVQIYLGVWSIKKGIDESSDEAALRRFWIKLTPEERQNGRLFISNGLIMYADMRKRMTYPARNIKH